MEAFRSSTASFKGERGAAGVAVDGSNSGSGSTSDQMSLFGVEKEGGREKSLHVFGANTEERSARRRSRTMERVKV